MKFTSQQYAQALFESVSQTKAQDHDKVLDNFVKILAQNGDLERLKEIESAYLHLSRESKGIKEAEITVARDIEINRGIVDELNKIAGHKLEIKHKVDEKIVGGVVIRIDDTLIDASIKNQLNKLNQSLKN